MKTLSRQISYLVGVIGMFVGGIFYVVMSDLSFQNTSDWLIISVLLSFGSAICMFLSVNFAEKPTILYLLKGLGVALGIGFVVFLHLFQTTDFYVSALDAMRKDIVEQGAALSMSVATMIISLVFGYTGLAGQIGNVVLTVVFKED